MSLFKFLYWPYSALFQKAHQKPRSLINLSPPIKAREYRCYICVIEYILNGFCACFFLPWKFRFVVYITRSISAAINRNMFYTIWMSYMFRLYRGHYQHIRIHKSVITIDTSIMRDQIAISHFGVTTYVWMQSVETKKLIKCNPTNKYYQGLTKCGLLHQLSGRDSPSDKECTTQMNKTTHKTPNVVINGCAPRTSAQHAVNTPFSMESSGTDLIDCTCSNVGIVHN
jgi:hypothetical protein